LVQAGGGENLLLPVRKRLWQLHSWLGLVAGLALLVIGLTGSVLVFHEELTALFSPDKNVVTPSTSGRLPLDTLLRHAERQLPDYEVTGWQIQNERPRLADHLYVIRRGDNVWLTATLNPYTGALLSQPHAYNETLRGWLLDLHNTFFAGDIGLAITGVFGALLCILGLSGVYLYRQFWKHVFTFRWRRGARILFSDFHKFTGICSVGFNLIFGFTGAYWNIAHTFDHIAGKEVEQPVIERRLYPDTLSLDAIVADSAARLPGFQTNFISLPSVPDSPGVILWGAVEPRGLLATAYASTVSYAPGTSAHVSTKDHREAGRWAQVTDTFEALHFGNFAGLTVKIIWSLAGLTPGILGITGFSIWLLRRRSVATRTAPAPALTFAHE
jgi:uncharacterized iron-regulated membrane protein